MFLLVQAAFVASMMLVSLSLATIIAYGVQECIAAETEERISGKVAIISLVTLAFGAIIFVGILKAVSQ